MITSRNSLGRTRGLCPVCLAVLPADIRRPSLEGREGEEAGEIRLERHCPEHGFFSEVIWRGRPDFESWRRPKKPAGDGSVQTRSLRGCPYDCGRCPEHKQHPCTVLFEITRRCNLRCPVCFAASGEVGKGGADEEPFAPLALLLEQLRWIRAQAGPVVLQISGGEPTLHPQLPELVRAAVELFPAVQLNSNGLLLAERPGLAAQLAAAGLSWVFLQFDGLDDHVYRALRGRDLLEAKRAAVRACAAAGLAVVLVPTLAAGVNADQLGGILDFALEHYPTVRGLHIQPMSASGRNTLVKERARPGAGNERITLPETLQLLSAQSRGRIRPEHASPPGCEHERCSFHCRYTLEDDGSFRPLLEAACCSVQNEEPAVGRAISSVIRNWQGPLPESAGEDELTRFINQARRRVFSVTCMAFQDAATADLERLQGCCVHVYAPPDRLMPFCSYNLTRADGSPLHRRRNGV